MGRRRESPEYPVGGLASVRRALGYLRSYKAEASGAFVALILSSAASLATPQLIRVAIDEGIAPQRLRIILLAVGGLVGAALLRGLFQFLQGYLAERVSQGVAYDLRNVLFEKIERLGFGYYDRVETGQLVTRLTSDVEQIRTFAGSGVVQLAAAVVMLVGTTTLLFLTDWRLTLLSLTVVPVIMLLLLRFVRRIGPLFRGVQQTLGRLNSVLQEDLAGIKVIRTFAREDYERDRYHSVNDELLERNLETVRELVDMRDRDRGMLEDRAAELETVLGSRPEVRIADGYPANVLLEAAQEEWPSLVVVGSRGLAGIMRTRLGSVSTKVVTASHGPVLVCPHVE